MKNYEHYTESKKRWDAWRERQDEDPIQGFMNWEEYITTSYSIEKGSKAEPWFKLECWTRKDGLPIIFQFWPEGKGFQAFEIKHDNKQSLEVLKEVENTLLNEQKLAFPIGQLSKSLGFSL